MVSENEVHWVTDFPLIKIEAWKKFDYHSCIALLIKKQTNKSNEQVDVMLPLKTRRPAAMTELITHV